MKYYSTVEAAQLLGYNDDAYVRRLIQNGRLKAVKVGKSWAIHESSIHELKLEKKINSDYSHWLSLNYELKFIADDCLIEMSSASNRHGVLHMFLGKAYTTHGAILKLCESGFGQDAYVLVRSLVENMINLKYILSVDDDSLADQYFAFDAVVQEQMINRNMKRENFRKCLAEKEENPNKNDMSFEEIKREAREARSKYGFKEKQNEWSGIGIMKMAKNMGLEDIYNTVYVMQCQLSHPSSRGMNTYYYNDNGGVVMSIGANTTMIEDALVTAFDMYLNILALASDFMGWKLEDKLEEVVGRFEARASVLNDEFGV